MLLYAGCGWQIVRFLALTTLLILIIFPESGPAIILLTVWPAVSQLVLAAAFLFLALDSVRYGAYRNLLLLGKTIDAVVGVFLLLYQTVALFLGGIRPLFAVLGDLEFPAGAALQPAALLYYSLAAVVLLDLLFLLLLISLSPTPEPISSGSLPEMSEVRLEEE